MWPTPIGRSVLQCYRGIARVLKPGAPFLDYDLFDLTGASRRGPNP
jgi:hypothetical protein